MVPKAFRTADASVAKHLSDMPLGTILVMLSLISETPVAAETILSWVGLAHVQAEGRNLRFLANVDPANTALALNGFK